MAGARIPDGQHRLAGRGHLKRALAAQSVHHMAFIVILEKRHGARMPTPRDMINQFGQDDLCDKWQIKIAGVL